MPADVTHPRMRRIAIVLPSRDTFRTTLKTGATKRYLSDERAERELMRNGNFV